LTNCQRRAATELRDKTTNATTAIRQGDPSPQNEYATDVMLSKTGIIVKHLDKFSAK